MRAMVVGAGPVGQWVSMRFLDCGWEVTLVARPAAASVLRHRGLRVRAPSGARTHTALDVAHDLATGLAVNVPDLIALCMKAYDVPIVARELAALTVPGRVPFIAAFQNGLGSEATLAEVFGRECVVAATTTTPLSLSDDGALQVEREGGDLCWAACAPDAPAAAGLIRTLTTSGLGQVYDDADALKGSKMLLNLIGNASGAILDLSAAALFADRRLFDVELDMLREAIAVLRASKTAIVNLPSNPAATLATLVRCVPAALLRPLLRGRFSRGRGNKRPSFYYDLASGRGRSEVAWLNGAVATRGATLGVPTPVNAALTSTLQGIVEGRVSWARYQRQPEALLAAVRAGTVRR